MFKLAVLFLIAVAACNGSIIPNIGSYKDRPELLSDRTVQDLINNVADSLFMGPKPYLKNIQIVRVQTQLVHGTNYKIDFIGEPVNGNGGQKTTCQVVINVRLDAGNSILQSQCQTS